MSQFWSAYTVDVYAATTFGGIVRHREAQSTVLYPALVHDDDEITERGIVPPIHSSSRPSYLVGWNFTTHLYRILEHALDQLRMKRLNTDSSSRITNFHAARGGPTPQEGLELVAQLYAELPDEFKGAQAMTGDMKQDRYGFQGEFGVWVSRNGIGTMDRSRVICQGLTSAADIIVTMQTVKMVMLGLEDATVERRCAVAGELLDALATVPTAYIQAISSPIVSCEKEQGQYRRWCATCIWQSADTLAPPFGWRWPSAWQCDSVAALAMVVSASAQCSARHRRPRCWAGVLFVQRPRDRQQAPRPCASH